MYSKRDWILNHFSNHNPEWFGIFSYDFQPVTKIFLERLQHPKFDIRCIFAYEICSPVYNYLREIVWNQYLACKLQAGPAYNVVMRPTPLYKPYRIKGQYLW